MTHTFTLSHTHTHAAHWGQLVTGKWYTCSYRVDRVKIIMGNYDDSLTWRWSPRSHTSSEPLCSRGRAAQVCEGRPRVQRAQPAPRALSGPPAQRQCPEKFIQRICRLRERSHPSQILHYMKLSTAYFQDEKSRNVFIQQNYSRFNNII